MNSLQSGLKYHAEVRLKNKTGEYRWHFAQGEPVRGNEGRIIKWIGSFTDVHDQKTLSNQLELLVTERTKELERSNDDLQQFAHVASHDLKEPVRKVKIFNRRLNQEFGDLLPEKAKVYMDKIETAANRMYSMIDGVLLYSSFEATEQVVEEVDLNKVLMHIQKDLEIIIQEKEATISHEPLPVMEGYPILLHQLFYNLINNSLKFSKPGIPPIIAITVGQPLAADLLTYQLPEANYTMILIKDNGIGFNQTYHTQIFKTFTRLHPKDRYEGTGLGLSLCKKIMQRHGGIIDAEGNEEEGAVFKMIMPIRSGVQ